jgi:hypothetical protein
MGIDAYQKILCSLVLFKERSTLSTVKVCNEFRNLRKTLRRSGTIFELIFSLCVLFLLSCKLCSCFHFSAFQSLWVQVAWSYFVLANAETQYWLSPIPFPDFVIRRLTLCSVFASGVSKPRNLKVLGPHPSLISQFDIYFYFLFVHQVFRNHEILNPETPKCWSHIPFTFSQFDIFLLLFVCASCVQKIVKSRTPKPRSASPTFHSLFHNLGVVVCWCLAFEIVKS